MGWLLASSHPEPPLSDIAMSAAHCEDSPYFAGWRAYNEDPYDPVTNPAGVIQMGLAENQVCAYCLSYMFNLAKNCKMHASSS